MHASPHVQQRFDALFAAHYPQVRAYVARRGVPAVVDDAVSETFLVAWRKLDAIPEDALPWLLAVARRVLANQRRSEARRGALVEALAGALPRAHAPEPDARVYGDLGPAIAALPPREREALLLVVWEDLEPQRAAQVVGCTAVAFRARLSRARRRLAAALADPLTSPAPEEAVR